MKSAVFFFSLCSLSHGYLAPDISPTVLKELKEETKCLDMLYGSSTSLNVAEPYLLDFVGQIRTWCLALTILKISRQQILERKNEIKGRKKNNLKNENFDKLDSIEEAILKIKQNIKTLVELYIYSKIFSAAKSDDQDMTNLIMKAQNDDDA